MQLVVFEEIKSVMISTAALRARPFVSHMDVHSGYQDDDDCYDGLGGTIYERLCRVDSSEAIGKFVQSWNTR